MTGATGKARILVVEDEFLIALTVEDILTAAGYDVVGAAASFEQAIDLARRCAPDLVLMDIRLASERDGIDAALEIRRLHDIPSLFASANLDPQNRARAVGARPAGWLPKPYTPESLLAAVAEALPPAAGRCNEGGDNEGGGAAGDPSEAGAERGTT